MSTQFIPTDVTGQTARAMGYRCPWHAPLDVQYALFWMEPGELHKLIQRRAGARVLFDRLRREYQAVVAPGRAAACLPSLVCFPKPKYARVFSADQRAKIAAANRARLWSAASRAKQSASSRGRRHTQATRAKQSAAQRGRMVSEDTRAKLAAAARGRVANEDTRAKLAAAMQQRQRDARGRLLPTV